MNEKPHDHHLVENTVFFLRLSIEFQKYLLEIQKPIFRNCFRSALKILSGLQLVI